MAANDPGQPTLSSDAAALAATATIDLAPPAASWRSAPTPTTSSSAPAARWPSGPPPAASSTTSSAPTARRARGTPTPTLAALVARRRDEQREAARRLAGADAGEVRSSGASTASSRTTRRRGARSPRSIRELRPTSCSATTRGSATGCTPITATPGLLVCDAIVGARDPHFFHEHGLPHHRPAALMLLEADAPNHAEDVSATSTSSCGAARPREPVRVDDEGGGRRPAICSARSASGSPIRLAELGAPWGLGTPRCSH